MPRYAYTMSTPDGRLWIVDTLNPARGWIFRLPSADYRFAELLLRNLNAPHWQKRAAGV